MGVAAGVRRKQGHGGGRVQTEEAGKGDEIQTIRRGRGLDDGVPTDLCPH